MSDTKRLILEGQGFGGSAEAFHDEAMRNMALQLNGHPRAQDFEPTGHGGSDPTAMAGTMADRAAMDGKAYTAAAKRYWSAGRELDAIARRYRNGVRPERQPEDPQDVWCVLHFKFDAHEPRYRGQLCRPCYEQQGRLREREQRELSDDDVRFHARYDKWPRKATDPKQRPRVDYLQVVTDADAANALTRGQHLAGLDALREGAQTLEPITSTGTV